MSHGIRMSTTSKEAKLLEELRAAYQRLGRKERQQVKSVLRTLAKRLNDTPILESEHEYHWVLICSKLPVTGSARQRITGRSPAD